jgi:Ca2+-binding RTX toxin-like protein
LQSADDKPVWTRTEDIRSFVTRISFAPDRETRRTQMPRTAARQQQGWVSMSGTIGVSGAQYYAQVSDPLVTWTASQAAATAMGGHLVTLTSAAEAAFVLSLTAATLPSFWIGLTDAAVEGSFVWVTGEAFVFSDFASGQPDNRSGSTGLSEDYAQVAAASGRRWNDLEDFEAGQNNGAVIEFEGAGAFVSAANGFDDASSRFVGSAGADTISAGAGEDTLEGGAGLDRLRGGRGADLFVLGGPADGPDRIVDFTTAEDRLGLVTAGFGQGWSAGPLDGALFESNGTGRATDLDTRIIYDIDSGRLFYDADGSADGSDRVLLAVLGGAPTLALADLIVI